MADKVEFIVTLDENQHAFAQRIADKNREREAKGHKPRGTLTASTVAGVVEQMFAYGLSRLETLDRHERKVQAVKANGADAGVVFRRYEPAFKDVRFADPSQDEAVKAWAAEAPHR